VIINEADVEGTPDAQRQVPSLSGIFRATRFWQAGRTANRYSERMSGPDPEGAGPGEISLAELAPSCRFHRGARAIRWLCAREFAIERTQFFRRKLLSGMK